MDDATTTALARAMVPTLDRGLRVNRGFALPVSGDSMDAVIRALGSGVERVEVERIDRGPLTQPAELSEEEAAIAFDLQRNVDKGRKWHQVNDQHAADLQLQFQGCIGELPRG